jgi:hypothetical protein
MVKVFGRDASDVPPSEDVENLGDEIYPDFTATRSLPVALRKNRKPGARFRQLDLVRGTSSP